METVEELLRNPAYRHVVLNHFPITGLLLAWIVLGTGAFLRERAISLLGLVLVALTAGSALVVMSAGENAYPLVREALDAAGRERLDRHADLAGFWGVGLYLTAALAVAGLGVSLWSERLTRTAATAVAAAAAASLVAVLLVAEAGGRIRHVELRQEGQQAGAAPSAAGPVAMRRLNRDQYRAALVETFGDGIEIVGALEPETRRSGLLAVGSAQMTIPPSALEQYESIATGIASQVLSPERRSRTVPCAPASPAEPDDACAERFVRAVGEQLFRRRLADEEVAPRVVAARSAGAVHGDFYVGLQVALESLLVSPEFLFRIERTEESPEGPGSAALLSDDTLAMRLGYFLWNAAPDAALRDAAARGELRDPAQLGRQVDRMIASPRLEDGVRAFFFDLLRFDDLDAMNKDLARYPTFTRQLADDAREQTLRVIVDHVVSRQEDYRDLFVTRQFFMTRSLGHVYRVPVRATQGWEPYEFPADDPRAGLLSHASLAMLYAHPGKTSPTLRGKFLREVFLCQSVPAAPANVELALFNDDTNPDLKTARDRLEVHSTNGSCRGCHRMIDPIGLGLERFDGIGAYRVTENEARIDVSGDLDGTSFVDAAGLGAALRDHPLVVPCLVETMYRYAVGREEVRSERTALSGLRGRFATSGYRIPELMRAIATSETFRTASPAAAPAAQQARRGEGRREGAS